VFEDTADAASLFALQKYETIHSRILDTTVAAFNERTDSQEEGLGAVIDKQRSGAPLPHLRGAHRRVTTSWPVPACTAEPSLS